MITLFPNFMAMDEIRLYVLALFMVIKHAVVALLAFQQIVMYVQNVEMMMMAVMFLKDAK